MGFLDFLRRKRVCSNCGAEADGLHGMYSGKKHGEEYGRICTACLLRSLSPYLSSQTIVFYEPASKDAYCFTSVSDSSDHGLGSKRLSLALANIGGPCNVCAVSSRHLWMSAEDLDWSEMEKQPASMYNFIAKPPDEWENTLALCSEHMVEKLGTFIAASGFHFLTFRLPYGSEPGYYS